MAESKKRRMTNRELARWLAQGNGQIITISCNSSHYSNPVTYYGYSLDDDDSECGNCKIRGWDENEWHEPLMSEE